MSFQDFFLLLEWHGDGFGSYCDLANFSDVSKSRISDDTDLAHFSEGVQELNVEKENRGADLSEMGDWSRDQFQFRRRCGAILFSVSRS